MSIALRHSGVVVSDLEKSLWFYRDLLGFKVTIRADESGTFIEQILGLKNLTVTTVKMTPPDGLGLLELLCFHPPYTAPLTATKSVNTNGWTHIALTVKNLDVLHGELCKVGINFISPPALSPNGKVKVAFCRDPEGNFLELVQEF